MINPLFQPFPMLHTERLVLRQPTTADAQDLFKMRSDPEVMQYIPRPLATNVQEVVDLVQMINDFTAKNERINWAMEWLETGEVVGMIGFVNIKTEHHRAEVGYSLAKRWHRMGIAREALTAVLDYGFGAMGLHSMEAITDGDNIASGKLLEKVGFRKEAHFIQDFWHCDAFRDSIHYGLLAAEYNMRQSPHV